VDVAEILRTTLGDNRFAVLKAVGDQSKPSSGRAIATALRVSPTTATEHLAALEVAGLVRSSQAGRARLWSLNVDSDLVRSWLREAGEVVAQTGVNPASTGGAGVTFERKVVAAFLARLLARDGAVGLRPGQRVELVALQQAPEFTVDDVVVKASQEGEVEPSLVMAVAARRAPTVVQSDEKSQKLFKGYVHQLMLAEPGGPELRLGLAVSGSQDQANELKVLAGAAEGQSDAAAFFGLVRTPGKFNGDVRGRLVQVEGLVGKALADLGVVAPAADMVERWTWELLSRMEVWSPRMEGPDDTDWADLPRVLQPLSVTGTLLGGALLRDRLLTLADEWAPVAASVDVSLVRRRAHDLLHSTVGRHAAGWRALDLLGEQAQAAVEDEIASADGARRVRVDRGDVVAALMSAVRSSAGVVLHGDSGVGKSSVALGLAASVASERKSAAGAMQVVCLNLRHLPDTALQFEGELGVPLQELLGELSAPSRVLVVDGADAVVEGRQPLLTYVVRAAAAAGVRMVAVAASEARQLVADTVGDAVGKDMVEVPVPSLTDPQVDAVVAEFGELEAMAANQQSRELLRRPVVVQLLVRGGVKGVPVSDFDAMRQVWEGLVLRRNRPGLGQPDARELVMLQLARQPLVGRDVFDVAASLDPDAVEGLRRDGLLRTPAGNRFRPLPEFTHDEVRRYAVARALLGSGEDPTAVLAEAGVPRWALGAARLACQAKLAEDPSPGNPLADRFERWQGRFDALVQAGGERWRDVPGEALLTLGDPRPLLRDAWPQLRANEGAGVQRLVRLVDQRLRTDKAFVRVAPVEPLIELLLENEMPWRVSKPERSLLLDWLRALAMSGVPAGYELRCVLRARLVAFCAAADERLRVADEEREAERAAREAAKTDADRAEEAARLARLPKGLFKEYGWPKSRTPRKRPRISQEITNEVVVELFALLGPDLGEDGEAALRRVAEAAPEDLQPAVEGISCGHALGAYRQGFLAEMVLAYYLDDEQDGLGGHVNDEGIRDHRYWGIGTPLSAHWKGPFMALFQTDPIGGIAALNKMCNHAALVRARTTATEHGLYGQLEDSDLTQFLYELDITGARGRYIGDGNVWNWYRGTGVGPYPCLSGLQALERVCDHIVGLGMPLKHLVSILLDGCENLAIVALVVGLIVRHLENAGTLLDPFLAEPDLWHLEFNRVVHDHGLLVASSDGIVHAERRRWSLREAAAALVLTAGLDRAADLRAVGDRLIERSRERIEQLGDSVSAQAIEVERNTVRGWASGLDQASYSTTKTDEGWVIESRPPPEVSGVLSEGLEWVARSQRAMRFTLKYYIDREDGSAEPTTIEELVADLGEAAALLNDPHGFDDLEIDGLAAVAAVALQEHLRNGLPLPDPSVKIAAEILLGIIETETPLRDHSIEESYFSQGADRSAARVLPLLLTPEADHALRVIDGGDGAAAHARILGAVARLASSTVLQTRLFLARGLDDVWASPCTHNTTCVHQVALRTTLDMMRECVIGEWNMERQENTIEAVDDPVVETLPAVAIKDLRVSRLDPAIRALGAAASTDTCVTTEARALLDVMLDAQRRALLAREQDTDWRGTHALTSARALLSINDDAAILTHVNAYIDNPSGLHHTLAALSAAAEEHPNRAKTAHRIWPAIVDRVLDAHDAGHTTFDRDDRDYTMGALLPALAGDGTYLHTEHADKPIPWWDPNEWQDMVQRWLGVAAGKSKSADRLVRFCTAVLSQHDQARLGLPWVSTTVLADPTAIAARCYNVAPWLIEIRTAAQDAGALNEWQRTVDALVVAGDSCLAPYSE
jgi:DNA-binding transcriptional ArsR family regulator